MNSNAHTEEHANETVEEHASHAHASGGDVWDWNEFGSIIGSLEHWVFELVTSVVFYLIFGLLIYRFIIQTHVIPRLRKDIHAEIDQSHGVEHK